MNPLIIQGIQLLIQYGPGAYKAFVELLHKSDPTQADWEALLQHATQQKYDDYIAAAKLRAGMVAPSV